MTSREDGESSSELICPSCNLPICDYDYANHVENCLATRDIDVEVDAPELEEVDVDSVTGVETYTWAGYTRVRATSLVDGQLRGPGFVSLTRTDEDQELDIEGDDDDVNQSHGKPQYTEADLILPQPGNKKINSINYNIND